MNTAVDRLDQPAPDKLPDPDKTAKVSAWIKAACFWSTAIWAPGLLLTVLGRYIVMPPISSLIYIVSAAYLAALAVGLYLGYRAQRNSKIAHDTLVANGIALFEELQAEQRAAGEASELRVANAFDELTKQFDGNANTYSGDIFCYPDVRPGQMTRFEVDVFAVTNFGIFLVEVKNWKHPVIVDESGWRIERPDGVETVKSPLAQNASKVRVIREIVAQPNLPKIPVYSVVVLSHAQACFSGDAPEDVLYMGDLHYYLRTAYLRARKTRLLELDEVQSLTEAISDIVDPGDDAKHSFLLELAANKRGAQEYLDLENRRQHLLRQPPAIQQSAWRHPLTYLPALLVLLACSVYFTYQHNEAQQQARLAQNAAEKATAEPASASGRQKKHLSQRRRHAPPS